MGNLSKLERLNFNGNRLSGSIPSELGNLTELETLYLDDNDLTGSIPASLGDLPKLEVLYLARNGLDGEIPSALGNLSKLDELILSADELSGSIPGSLGSLSALTSLWLRDNDLSGQIPVELVEIPSLGELFLSDNQLTGCVPVGLREVASNDLGSLGLADCQAPEPENVVATSTGATSIDLSWDEVDDTTVYRVEYRASDAAEWTLDDDTISSATYTVDELACNTSYAFRVSAYGDGETYVADWGAGAEVSATTGACS